MINEQKKYIGIVKWYGNKRNNAEYGFINNKELGDVFVHKDALSNGTIILHENDIVIFNIQRSNNREKKLESINVYELFREKKINILIVEYYNCVYNKSNQLIITELETQIKKTISEDALENFKNIIPIVKQRIQDIIDAEDYSATELFKKYSSMFRFTQEIFSNNFESIFNNLTHTTNEEFKVLLWLESLISQISFQFLLGIFSQQEKVNKKIILSKCSNEEQYLLLQHSIRMSEKYDDDKKIIIISEIISLSKDLNKKTHSSIIKLIIGKSSTQIKFDLWYNGQIDDYQSDFTEYIVQGFEDFDYNKQKEILSKCESEIKNDLFFKLFRKFENINAFDGITSVLDLCKELSTQNYNDILNILIGQSDISVHVYLWINDYFNHFNFDQYYPHIFILSKEEQQKFLKKIFMLIHKGDGVLTLNDILKIQSYYIAKKDDTNMILDYSVGIVLSILKEISLNNNNISQKKMLEIILDLIKTPKDLLKIGSFFDRCEGRAYIIGNMFDFERENSVLLESEYNRNDILCEFCEGRKAMENGSPVLDNTYNKEFWWCSNQKCFKSSRRLHGNHEWENYTIADFLNILNISFNEIQYEILMGTVNKTNRFLDHIYCRECKHILYPKGQTNYAFHRVNWFQCINHDCSIAKKREEIYISHCINGKCDSVIDSRDSARCIPKGYEDQNCGWFVCFNCFACCTTEKINKRKYIMEKTGQNYTGHNEGHADQGKICCYKCGNDLVFHNEEYHKALQWFINNKDNRSYIIKYGQRNDGKIWFLFKQPAGMNNQEYKKKLRNLFNIGFSVPDLDEEKNLYLVCEGDIEKTLKCINCGFTFDLNELIENHDYSRLHALKYHVVVSRMLEHNR